MFWKRKRVPDLRFAAEGFVQMVHVGRDHPKLDVHDFEYATAMDLLRQGCTEEQAWSARWGGVCGIDCNLAFYRMGVAAYDETVAETLGPDVDDPRGPNARLLAGAMCHLGMVMDDAPGEYERFRRYMAA